MQNVISSFRKLNNYKIITKSKDLQNIQDIILFKDILF